VGRYLGPAQPTCLDGDGRASPALEACRPGYRSRVVALIVVALAVGLGNFGAAVGIGVSGVDRRLRLRLAAIFGFFEGLMPVVGLLLGRATASDLGRGAPIAGGILLGLIGAYSVAMALVRKQPPRDHRGTPTGRLLLVGAALSVDNLVIGFALGTYHVNLVLAVIVIALTSVGLSLLGLELGSRLRARFGERSELVGGAALIVVGIAIGTGIL
jgi:manganese efflux pump family protein